MVLPLEYSHDAVFVLASMAIALMAGFTGLSLTRGASRLETGPRKRLVSIAAVILGGGIWSMHFVAMLGLQLPVLFFYDALITLISALIAILVVGIGLLILHFRDRSPATLTTAGVVIGGGILAMHYVGMAGMQACRAVYTPAGVLVSVVVSLALSTAAIWIAYGERTRRNILLGTTCFALAVVALHFMAIWGAQFFVSPLSGSTETLLSNEALAFVVTLTAFAICAAFFLAGATFLPASNETDVAGLVEDVQPAEEPVEPANDFDSEVLPTTLAVPFEQNGRTMFVDASEVAAFRAEGHYTIIYFASQKGFCPWSISEAEKRLASGAFLRAHRSYLINPRLVSGFERKKDSGVAYFDTVASLEKVPISRSRLPDIRESLGF